MQKIIYRYGDDGRIEFYTGERWSAVRALAKVYKGNASAVSAIKGINKKFPDTKPFVADA